MSSVIELWLPITGYDGQYEISNFGNVRSKKSGHFKNKSKRILNKQYYATTLHINGFRKTFKIHRLVAMAFIPNPKNKPQVNHIDGNKLNNHANNLEWCTAKENMIHALKNGLLNSVGVSNYQTNLTERDVQIIRWMSEIGCFSYEQIAEFLSITKSNVAHIVKGRSFKHLPIDYSKV